MLKLNVGAASGVGPIHFAIRNKKDCMTIKIISY